MSRRAPHHSKHNRAKTNRASHRSGSHRSGNHRSGGAQNKGALPKNAPQITLTISHIGGRGDGVGVASYTHHYQTKEHQVFVPNTLPGEEVIAQPHTLNGQGIQADLRELVTSSDDRKEPDCNAYPACGGCQFQHMQTPSYEAWKSAQLQAVLTKFGITPEEWRTPYQAPMQSRRRARLAFRRRRDDVIIGFRARASHHIIPPDACSILDKAIMTLLDTLRDDIFLCLEEGMIGDVDITSCDEGLDVTCHVTEEWPASVISQLTMRAAQTAIGRLSLAPKGQAPYLLFTNELPTITWHLPASASQQTIQLHPAPASFLQADRGAEQLMISDIFETLAKSDMILDLFAGSGTLSAPLLFRDVPPRKIAAYDSVKDALACYEEIAHKNGKATALDTHQRNLFDAPLTAKELEGFDAVIIDPPRAGATAQMPALAASHIPHIMMVSCNPHSFAKDAQLLQQGGYRCIWARHIDQFVLTSHSELIAYFHKETEPIS